MEEKVIQRKSVQVRIQMYVCMLSHMQTRVRARARTHTRERARTHTLSLPY